MEVILKLLSIDLIQSFYFNIGIIMCKMEPVLFFFSKSFFENFVTDFITFLQLSLVFEQSCSIYKYSTHKFTF